MDAFDWIDVFTRVSPKRVASALLFGYTCLLCAQFGPAWDLFDWAVQQRVRQLTDSVLAS